MCAPNNPRSQDSERSESRPAANASDDLNGVGIALVRAASSGQIDLTVEQQHVLAQAPQPDVVDAVASAVYELGGWPMRQAHLAEICWTEYVKALGDYSTLAQVAEALKSQKPFHRLRQLIETDNRLTVNERDPLLAALDSDLASDQVVHGPAYLSAIAVSGFRGIGEAAELVVRPGPGLTVIYGTNGQGKSSFVDALEVLLTGGAVRFNTRRGAEWLSAWANAHASKTGQVEATFVLPDHYGGEVTLLRRWTGNPVLEASGSMAFSPPRKAPSFDVDPRDKLRDLGWSDAVDAFRPILGYAELGPLFDETATTGLDDDHLYEPERTPLGHHVAVRAGIADALLNSLHLGIEEFQGFVSMDDVLSSLRAVVADRNDNTLAVTHDLTHTLPEHISEEDGVVLRPFTRHEATLRPLSPKQWDWRSIASRYDDFDSFTQASLACIARAYEGYIDFDMGQISHERYDHLDLDMEVAHNSGTHLWRSQVYGYMLVDAIHQARLRQFSHRCAEIWRTIRHSAVSLDGIEFALVPPRSFEEPSATRVSFRLSTGGLDGIERGFLSQGELQTLGLSTFLPTITQPKSPFRFAVIDDPVQVMDQYAVAGLAQVLDEYAKELQLIVFTHDERLPLALRRADIDHTLIDIQRSDESVVKCEVLYDPVTQRLRDAREEARRPESDNWMGRRQDVADQCRRAIEAACTRAVVRRRIHEGQPAVDIFEEIDRLKEDSKSSMRGLLALAIWGEEGKIGEVSKFLTEQKSWGEEGAEINETLNQVNKLVHAADADAAKAAYAGDDLDKLIDKVELVIKAIEANCG